jgi:hypothetical protein
MASIPLVTSRVQAVNPRTAYTHSLTDGTSGARLLLSNVSWSGRKLSAADVRDAVALTDADIVCLYPSTKPGLRKLREAGFGDEPEAVGDLLCLISGTDRAVTTRQLLGGSAGRGGCDQRPAAALPGQPGVGGGVRLPVPVRGRVAARPLVPPWLGGALTRSHPAHLARHTPGPALADRA